MQRKALGLCIHSAKYSSDSISNFQLSEPSLNLYYGKTYKLLKNICGIIVCPPIIQVNCYGRLLEWLFCMSQQSALRDLRRLALPTYRYLHGPELSAQLAVELQGHFGGHTHHLLFLHQGPPKQALRGDCR